MSYTFLYLKHPPDAWTGTWIHGQFSPRPCHTMTIHNCAGSIDATGGIRRVDGVNPQVIVPGQVSFLLYFLLLNKLACERAHIC